MYVGSSTPDPNAGASIERRKQPLRAYVVGALRRPRWAMSDIAIDRPLFSGMMLFIGSLILAGVVLGAGGLPQVGDGLRGAWAGAIVVPAFGVLGFMVVSVSVHLMARSLDGIASFTELSSALVFAMLPLYLLAPAGLLRFLPGIFGIFYFLTVVVIVLWIVRLIYIAIREAHRFLGLQAILSMIGPVLFAFLSTIVLFFVSVFATLIIG